MTVRLQISLFAIVILAPQVSCVSEPAGEFPFLSRDDIPRGKAVVYVYRPPSMLGTVGVCNVNLDGEMFEIENIPYWNERISGYWNTLWWWIWQ